MEENGLRTLLFLSSKFIQIEEKKDALVRKCVEMLADPSLL
jgi:hypothetical protein